MTDEFNIAMLQKEIEDALYQDLEYMANCFRTAEFANINAFNIDMDNLVILDGEKLIKMVNRFKKGLGGLN